MHSHEEYTIIEAGNVKEYRIQVFTEIYELNKTHRQHEVSCIYFIIIFITDAHTIFKYFSRVLMEANTSSYASILTKKIMFFGAGKLGEIGQTCFSCYVIHCFAN